MNIAHLIPNSNALDLALAVKYSNCDARIDRVLQPGKVISLVANESIELSVNKGGCQFSLLRKPSGKDTSVSIVGNRFTASVPGLYLIRCQIPGTAFIWDLDVAVFSTRHMDMLIYPNTFGEQRRMRLHGICSDPRVTRESIALSLEGGATTEPWQVLLGAKEGVDVRQWS